MKMSGNKQDFEAWLWVMLEMNQCLQHQPLQLAALLTALKSWLVWRRNQNVVSVCECHSLPPSPTKEAADKGNEI